MDLNDDKMTAINKDNNAGDATMNVSQSNGTEATKPDENGHNSGDSSMETQDAVGLSEVSKNETETVKNRDAVDATSFEKGEVLGEIDVGIVPVLGESTSSDNNIVSEGSESVTMEVTSKNNQNCDTANDSNLTNQIETVDKPTKTSSGNKTNVNKPKTTKSDAIVTGALSQLLDYGMSDSEDSESDSVSISDSSETNSEISDEIVVAKPVTEPSNRAQERFRENDSSSDSSTYYDSDSSSDRFVVMIIGFL